MGNLQLTLRTGPERGRSWILSEELLTIGRDIECDVILPHRSVSRRHCAVTIEGPNVYLRDLNSRNGTLVNGRPVNSCKIKIGDEVALGEVSLMITGESLLPSVNSGSGPADNTSRIAFHKEPTQLDDLAESPVRGLPQNLGDMARLFRVCRACGAVESLGGLLQLVEEEIKERLCPGRYWLALEGQKGLDILNWMGVGTDDPEDHFPHELSESIIASGSGRVLTRRTNLNGTETRVSTMVTTIAFSKKSIGVIVVEEVASHREYDDSDLEFLAALCYAIAPFIKLHDQKRALEAEVARYRAQASRQLNLVGSSESVNQLKLLVQLVAKSNQAILITGETGTGKDLVARLIHAQSERARGPFVAVNCAAIPSELFESEVFGHERGAFTGATGRRVGLLEESDGGTLFLDEVGDLSAPHQARILRALETQTFRRVGGDRDIHVDFRVLSATNKNLQDAAALGHFREDLFHRLRGFEIKVPALRDRPGDIPELAEFFLEEALAHARRPIRGFTDDALDYLRKGAWGGNVRELRQAIHSAVMVCQRDYLDVEVFSMYGLSTPEEAGELPSLEELEREHIERVLQHTGGKVTEAAPILGIARSTLYEKLRQYKIKRP
jgi:DNA-binding NtrC family response regulator